MPPARFEPKIPASELRRPTSLDRAATSTVRFMLFQNYDSQHTTWICRLWIQKNFIIVIIIIIIGKDTISFMQGIYTYIIIIIIIIIITIWWWLLLVTLIWFAAIDSVQWLETRIWHGT
jgi:hypothetical protein